MEDQVINFYSKIDNNKNVSVPKTWNNHHIYNNSMILCIGGTGAGKSNALLNYIHRSSGEFYKIIICSFSTTDEPLYNMLHDKEKSIILINNIEDVPPLSSFDNKFKDKPKLIVFDDFINLKEKEQTEIKKYLTAGRKFGFTVWLMAQNYVEVSKTIVRNLNYIIMFKLNDNVSIDRIIKNHNISNVSAPIIKSAYYYSTEKPLDFFLIDFKTNKPQEKFRHNFLNFLKL
jgi:hypothetical protein